MNNALRRLLQVLELEEIDRDLYRGQNEDQSPGRLFGGQVAAQSVVAAGRSVDGPLLPHSLHAYFLRPGDPGYPVVFAVDRIRDGRSFVTRRVVARQRGEAIFGAAVSFQVEEEGFEHAMSMPAVPPPEDVESWVERAKRLGKEMPDLLREWLGRERPFDFRPVDGMTFTADVQEGETNRMWVRANGRLDDDPFLHDCLFTYVSDMFLVETMVRQHASDARDRLNIQVASLDHAIWFHRPLRVDDWLLYAQDSPSAAGSRGFSRGSVFDRTGRIVASTAQEGLMRRIEPEKAPTGPGDRERSA